MARRKPNTESTTDSTPQEEIEVTDTDTTTEEVEAPEVETETKPPKEHVDHEGNLFDAIVAFASDGDVEALQEAYRSIPAAARGKAQAQALKRSMTDGGVDMDSLSGALDAFNSLPSAARTHRTKAEIDPVDSGAIRLAAMQDAYARLREELGEDAHERAVEWAGSEVPKDHANAVARATERVVKAASTGGRGGGGPRASFTEKLTDLIADGRLPVGATVTGAGDASAVVTADGLEVEGETYTNPTPAAKKFRVNKEGKETSTNGWDFWHYEAKTIGSLRTS